MTIETLINAADARETVRAAIANILAQETVAQQALATSQGEDARLWTLRVFENRARPWSEFLVAAESGADQLDVPPIVNVVLDTAQIDRKASDPVERQTYDARYFVDCIGYGVAEGSGSGHVPGDFRAASEADRCARLARNILQSAHYTYLGLRGVVGRRMIVDIQFHHVQPEPAINVAVVRLVLEVRLVEQATPQHVPESIAGVDVDVQRLDTGEVLFSASWDA